MPHAVFAGLCTLDVIQSVERVPGPNEKVTALRQTVAAGGPATNAAVTFAHLGGRATLLTGVGRHPLAAGVRADLAACRVGVRDLTPGHDGPPSVSSILVTAATGARAVASTNAAGAHLVPPDDLDLDGVSAVQVDGHHPALAEAVLTAARRRGIPTILDAGSWKDGTERLLPLADVVAASADFRAPGPLRKIIRGYGVPWLAVTAGADPIRWWGPGGASGQVTVPAVPVVDTLGAGDVFHGALTHAVAAGGLDSIAEALGAAAQIASRACAHFGTRTWMHHTDT
ncbi:sugar/nucleoside kinase (ribokinase family) [Catenuloplanes nepalensis]|uniref:Sugar/nucleoside kinase (Ribokinase family) n=1 Tax=Catenuloplanes nepalensis TaxID=587533 RepID=A0ABT9MZ46_9ACTN|nr:PfkB family carbohydrate kinase [Catenuloplanes nepalensis]MDP9796721.1 sugar/nucleoside kinase (ribokinase family) [Catenuloplanes nepalensis]